MASRNYKYYQPNEKDLKDNYGDCVVRALTKVTGKNWIRYLMNLFHMPKDFNVCLMENSAMKVI